MIVLHIEAETIAEMHHKALTALGFTVNAPAAAAESVAPQTAAVTQTYEPTVEDEAEVLPEMVQGEAEVDAAGEAWNEELHSPNKTKTKDGLWRKRKGAPEAKAEPVAAPEPEPEVEAAEDDEFAAFFDGEQQDAGIPARSWTDADLASLANQAAKALGNPGPVKELIGKFTPEGEVAHSRNIPAEVRDTFAAELEKLANITFAG